MFRDSDAVELVWIFLCALTCLFTALKLDGAIDWSWLWVLAPLWIPAMVAAAGAAVIVIGALWLIKKDEKNKRRKEK